MKGRFHKNGTVVIRFDSHNEYLAGPHPHSIYLPCSKCGRITVTMEGTASLLCDECFYDEEVANGDQ